MMPHCNTVSGMPHPKDTVIVHSFTLECKSDTENSFM